MNEESKPKPYWALWKKKDRAFYVLGENDLPDGTKQCVFLYDDLSLRQVFLKGCSKDELIEVSEKQAKIINKNHLILSQIAIGGDTA